MTDKNAHTAHHVLFMLGMLCFLGTLALLGLVVYLIPHVLFGWNYHFPDWIYTLEDWLQNKYELSAGLARVTDFFVLIVIAGILGGAAYGLSRWSAPPLIGEDPVVEESSAANAPPKDGIWVTVKLILMLSALLVVILFFQWLFFGNATTTPE